MDWCGWKWHHLGYERVILKCPRLPSICKGAKYWHCAQVMVRSARCIDTWTYDALSRDLTRRVSSSTGQETLHLAHPGHPAWHACPLRGICGVQLLKLGTLFIVRGTTLYSQWRRRCGGRSRLSRRSSRLHPPIRYVLTLYKVVYMRVGLTLY